MKQYKQRKKQMIEVLEPFMRELFFNSCAELQITFEEIGYREWNRMEQVLKEVLKKGKEMQEEGNKGSIHYLLFSFLQYGPRDRRVEIRVDLLEQGLYLDEQECSGYFCPDILQKQYSKDIEVLQKELSGKFIRLQKHEIQKMEVAYAERYRDLCGLMLKSMSEHIMEALSESGVAISDVVLLYGEYMDKAVILYKGDQAR